MISRAVTSTLLLVVTLCVSCKSTPQSEALPADAESASPAVYNVITAQQIADASLLGSTAYLAVQRLRPAYLIDKTAGARRSSQPIMVSVNGGQLSELRALESIPASTIAEIRYLTVGEASQRFNNRNTGPVILVSLMSR